MPKSVAIVTGASTGIGRATAIRLARDFEKVVLAARGANALQEVSDEVHKNGSEPLAFELDLMAPDAAELIVKSTMEQFGRIDALVNIAGAVPGIDLFKMTDDQWHTSFALKFHGARRMAITAWDALKASKGAVVFISGNAAVLPKANAAAIGTINAAIEALAKAFSERGVADGVQVNSVSPGAIMTGRRQALIGQAAAAKGIAVEDMKALFLRQAGIDRFGTAEEIADVIAFAVSPAARWMTGTVLRMDGGETPSL